MERHLRKYIPNLSDYPPEYFAGKLENLKTLKLGKSGTRFKTSEKARSSSFEISLFIAKSKKSHTIGETLISSISKIPFKPNAGPEETCVFKHYNPSELVLGKTMEEWLRFSVCFWHTFRGVGLDPFGEGTIDRHWDDGSQAICNAKKRIKAAFEFFTKLGVKYWTFHDRDIAPEGETLAETNKNLDEVVSLIEELQKQTGVKLLWATSNLFSNKRFMNGAATSSDAHVMAYAGAQLKKGLEVAKILGAENYVFWGGREGYQSLINANVKEELDHLAEFFRMAVAYKKKIGFKGVFLIEPKAKEPTRHQYDFDAQTVMAFLHQYGLKEEFKLNIEPNHTMLAGHPYEHDVLFSSIYGMLGSIDANTGSPDLGWDTDQFPMDVKNTTLIMKIVIEQKGIAPGGLNFDAKVRRESTALEDMFIAHIGAMDAFARGLKNAAKLISDGVLKNALQQRYVSWKSGIGAKVASGKGTLEDCEKYIKENGNPVPQTARQEHFESILNHYI